MHFRVLFSVFCALMYAGLVQASPYAYLANNSDNTVSVLDTATNAVAGNPIPVGSKPYGIAVNPQGSRVYVSCQGDKNIYVIDTAMLPYTTGGYPVTAIIQLANEPGGLAVNAAGTRLFVALKDNAGVDVINTVTNTKITSVTVANLPEGIAAVQAAGTYKVLVSNQGSDSLSVINADDTAGTYVNSNSDIALPAGSDPRGIAITSDGLYAYVANFGKGSVSKIDISTGNVAGTISAGSGPVGVAITANNGTLYVSNSASGTITSYNLATSTPNATINLPNVDSTFYVPYGIAVAPGGNIYTANLNANKISVMTSAGVVAAGPITIGTNAAPGPYLYSFNNFMGPRLWPISITTEGYGGYIYPADPMVSPNLASNTVLAVDGKPMTLNIIPDHNFAVTSITGNNNGSPFTLSTPFPSSYTFNNVAVDTNSIKAVFGRTHWDLTIYKNLYGGAGIGRVYTSVGGLDCTNGIPCNPDGQTASIPVGSPVTITAVASAADNSEFIGWEGGFCTGNSATCTISSLTYDTIVSAHFVKKNSGPARIGRPARLYGGTSTPLDDTYGSATSGETIDLLTLNNGNPFTITSGFNLPKNVTLVGGWTDWTTAPYGALPAASATTIQGPVTINLGSVTIGSYNNNGAIIIK